MISSLDLKNLVLGLGADLCGIAPVERFSEAPPGFSPHDIYEQCKSVIVFAKRLPPECLHSLNCVPYTHVNNIMTQEVDKLGIQISLELAPLGIGAIPIPSDDPYEHWEAERSYGRAILSMRHAGYLAGLGVLGKNTLLINDQYGNMIQLGAILVDLDLAGDPIATYEVCPESCRRCLDSCPQQALNGEVVNQHLCRPLSNHQSEKGYILKKCNLCRKVCPNHSGLA